MLFDDEKEMLVRCEAATPGPWFQWTSSGDVSSKPEDCRIFQSDWTEKDEEGCTRATKQGTADCEFVVAARTNLPEVLKRIGELRDASIRLLCAFANAPLDARGLEIKDRLSQCLLDPEAARKAREAYRRGDYMTGGEFIAEIEKRASEK